MHRQTNMTPKRKPLNLFSIRAFAPICVLFFFLCASCAGLQPRKEDDKPALQQIRPPRDLDTMRGQIRALLKAQAEAIWQSWALGQTVDLNAVYKNQEALFSIESIRKVENERAQEKDAEKARGLHYLKLYLAGEYVARATSAVSDSAASIAATSVINVDSKELPYRELETILANEAHCGRRKKIFRASDPVARKLNSALLERDKKLAEAIAALGYPSYAAFESDLRHADFPVLVALAEEVLQKTEAPFRAAMEQLAKKELGIALIDLRRSDIPRLFRTGDVDYYFSKEKEVEKIGSMLAKLGLELSSIPQLKIESSPHTRKNPRSLVVAVEPGKDVRLSVRPSAGFNHWAQLWHEVGFALHYSIVGKEEIEVQLLGNNATGETYGYLFEELLDEPELASELGVPEAKLARHSFVASLKRLYALRRAAGRVLFETAWRTSLSQQPPETTYRSIMSRALGFPADPEDGDRFLVENDDFLAAADEMRSMVAAAQLASALDTIAGGKWWNSPKAGSKLKELMATGGRPTVEELVAMIGAGNLDASQIVASLSRRIEVKSK